MFLFQSIQNLFYILNILHISNICIIKNKYNEKKREKSQNGDKYKRCIKTGTKISLSMFLNCSYILKKNFSFMFFYKLGPYKKKRVYMMKLKNNHKKYISSKTFYLPNFLFLPTQSYFLAAEGRWAGRFVTPCLIYISIVNTCHQVNLLLTYY